jgi:hypothetical protein
MERKTYNGSTINLHKVARIQIEQYKQEGDAPSNVTKVMVRDEDGHRTEVVMFSDEKIEVEEE